MSIVCPKCGGKTKSIDSRTMESINAQYRKRECLRCGCRFKTLESVVKGSEYYPNKCHVEPPATNDEMLDLYSKFGTCTNRIFAE